MHVITLKYCKTLFFRRILISRFPHVENSLHFNFVDFPVNFIKQLFPVSFGASNNVIIKIHVILWFTLHNTKILHIISRKCADQLVVMGNSKNLRVFNFAILLESQKFDAREIYMFYSTASAAFTQLAMSAVT